MRDRAQKACDLVVIGGGINGAAIARDAAMRGLKVILLEKSDFGAGASTKTSKLIHGGLRYLESLHFGLVKESLAEQALLLKNAPHLVHPLSFFFPVYSHHQRPLWQIHLGLYLYDFFSRNSGMPRHRKCTKQEITLRYPQLNREGLVGGCEYYDAQMLDNRIVIENILAAEECGAIVINYAEVIGLLETQDHISGVRFRNRLTGQEETISCKVVVNATGAWSNQIAAMESETGSLKVAPTKGIHLVIPQVTKDQALILHAPQDGRVFFILPWGKNSLLGTTDTYFHGDPDKVTIEDSDIGYLLEAFHFYFPEIQLNKSSIIAAFAGLRPLVASEEDPNSPSAVSRNHVIDRTKKEMITVLGGKYTTHRKIAEDVVNTVLSGLGSAGKFRPCTTKITPLPGAGNSAELDRLRRDLQEGGLQEEQVDHLIANYGRLCGRILAIIRDSSEEVKRICPDHPHIFAEVTYAIQEEHAKRLEDWFCRRTSIAYSACRGMNCLQKVAGKFAALLGWDQAEKDLAISCYENQTRLL